MVSDGGRWHLQLEISNENPDSKVHGANMGPTWGWQNPGGPHVGHVNLAIREYLLLDLNFTQIYSSVFPCLPVKVFIFWFKLHWHSLSQTSINNEQAIAWSSEDRLMGLFLILEQEVFLYIRMAIAQKNHSFEVDTVSSTYPVRLHYDMGLNMKLYATNQILSWRTVNSILNLENFLVEAKKAIITYETWNMQCKYLHQSSTHQRNHVSL